MHDVLSVAITVATILIASYFNQSAINSLRGEFTSLRTELNGKIDAIQRDMREFYAELMPRHDTRINALERTSSRG